VDVNSAGIHLVFRDSSGWAYRRSADGTSWTSAARFTLDASAWQFQTTGTVTLRATEEGLALTGEYFATYLAVADAAGSTWSPIVAFSGWAAPARAAIVGGKLHLLYGGTTAGTFYRSVDPVRYGDVSAYSAPVQVVDPGDSLIGRCSRIRKS